MQLSEESQQKLGECLTEIFNNDGIPIEAVTVDILLDISKLSSFNHPKAELSIQEEDASKQDYKLSLPLQKVRYKRCVLDPVTGKMKCF